MKIFDEVDKELASAEKEIKALREKIKKIRAKVSEKVVIEEHHHHSQPLFPFQHLYDCQCSACRPITNRVRWSFHGNYCACLQCCPPTFTLGTNT